VVRGVGDALWVLSMAVSWLGWMDVCGYVVR
jgi:hypothetical protein